MFVIRIYCSRGFVIKNVILVEDFEYSCTARRVNQSPLVVNHEMIFDVFFHLQG